MFCENCGDSYKRWEIEMVEKNDDVFEANSMMEDIEYNFACPPCRTFLELVPLQSERANTFREKNEKLRQVLEPTPIH